MSQRRGNVKNGVVNSPKTQSPKTAYNPVSDKKVVPPSPTQRKQEPQYQFGDTSDENVKIEEELKSLDSILQSLGNFNSNCIINLFLKDSNVKRFQKMVHVFSEQ
jgi:hypothetical protein